MKVPVSLFNGFGEEFEQLLARTCVTQGLLPSPEEIKNKRFLNRSIVPHVERLKELFNRVQKFQDKSKDKTTPQGLDRYWQKGSNPENLRLAYFLSFMPGNLYRMSAIWSELSRLGYRWPDSLQTLRAIEFGAGPATGACGVLAGEKHAPLGLPAQGSFALIEQDRGTLALGENWFSSLQEWLGGSQFSTRPFHRKLEPEKSWLPRAAPRFNLWLMSFVLNEFEQSPRELAATLLESWERHLEDEGLVILLEPAMKLQSRRLLELRQEILLQAERVSMPLELLLPCLGHQSCGALAEPEDWCHEEVSWWRPPYLRVLDELTGLDRKSLPFSYLVFSKSKKPRKELLPAIAQAAHLHRLVSPAHRVGPDWEFYWCGKEGKRRLRLRAEGVELERGSILLNSEFRGDENASRIDRFDELL